MSKITNDGLIRSGRMLYSCTHMATVGVKGLNRETQLCFIILPACLLLMKTWSSSCAKPCLISLYLKCGILGCIVDSRKFFFSHRVIGRWNSLDQEMMNAPSVNAFKGRLDKLTQTRVIGFFMD